MKCKKLFDRWRPVNLRVSGGDTDINSIILTVKGVNI